MYRVLLSTVLVIGLTTLSCKGQKKDKHAQHEGHEAKVALSVNGTASFGVRGNCKMCKKSIERAAMSVAGVSKATWNRSKKSMTVVYTGNLMDIHKSIAKAGYDTDKVKATDATYSNLPMCCQYDRDMEMSKAGGDHGAGHDAHSGH